MPFEPPTDSSEPMIAPHAIASVATTDGSRLDQLEADAMATLQGATLVLTPNWIIDTIFVDIQWDPTDLSNPVPQGPWGGRLALLAGTGSSDGPWDWDKTARRLLLWVPVSQTPLYRRLTGVLDQFTLPPANGAKG